MEAMNADGYGRPTGGSGLVYGPASGPGIRVDGFGYAGYRHRRRFDSLLEKVIVHAGDGDLAGAARKADRALSEFRIAGVLTNIPFLRALLRNPAFAAGAVHTRFIEEHAAALYAAAAELSPLEKQTRRAGAKLATLDPLAVLDHGKGHGEAPAPNRAPHEPSGDIAGPEGGMAGPEGAILVPAPLQGTIINIAAAVGKALRVGDPVVIMESMKMEHVIGAPISGVWRASSVSRGDTAFEGHALASIDPAELTAVHPAAEPHVDLDFMRPDLAALIERHRGTLDAGRPP